MIEYISATEAAEKWGLSRRRTQLLLAQGRIFGAVIVGKTWIVPADAKKPADARIKSGKYIKRKEDAR